MIARRTLLHGLGACGAIGLAGGPALAQAGRKLQVNIPANSLGVHIPYMAALNEILPAMPGYAVPEVKRVNSLRIITQSILSGTVEIGSGDPIGALRAVEAGADIKIVGYAFSNTSLVFVVNGDKIKSLQDLTKPDVTVAVNSKGDFTHILLVGPLIKQNIDQGKINIVEIGGSGARMRALLGGKVDGIPAHIDQARAIARQGNYKILVEPAKEYEAFVGEVWLAGGEWLRKPENQKAVLDLNKATITAFKRTHADFKWFAAMYRKYGTAKEMTQAPEEEIRIVWEALAKDVRSWPVDHVISVKLFESLLPVYKAAGAIQGTVDLEKAIEPRFAQEALKSVS
jgi:NitT/TauT family transport system substrate-binding protein